jgi:tyrosine aminotransferase
MASLTTSVPVITIGSASKTLLVPGWRLGWALLHDIGGKLAGIRAAMLSLTQLSMGPSSVLQAALPAALAPAAGSGDEAEMVAFYGRTRSLLAKHAAAVHEALAGTPGLLHSDMPAGAMYTLVRCVRIRSAAGTAV